MTYATRIARISALTSGLIAGNFLYQAVHTHDWSYAAQISWFQFVTACVISLAMRDDNQPTTKL